MVAVVACERIAGVAHTRVSEAVAAAAGTHKDVLAPAQGTLGMGSPPSSWVGAHSRHPTVTIAQEVTASRVLGVMLCCARYAKPYCLQAATSPRSHTALHKKSKRTESLCSEVVEKLFPECRLTWPPDIH